MKTLARALLIGLCATIAEAQTFLYLGTDATSLPQQQLIFGAWTETSDHITRRLNLVPQGPSRTNTFRVGVPPRHVLAYIGVGPRLAENVTVDGQFSWLLNVEQHDAELWTHVYVWWMKPDGTWRCTSVLDFSESPATEAEWPLVMAEHAASAPIVTDTPCAVLVGDRPVVEIGVSSPLIAGGEGVIGYGVTPGLAPPWVWFSQDLVFQPEGCAAPTPLGMTTDLVRFELAPPERCEMVYVYQRPESGTWEDHALPIASFEAGEIGYDGTQFVPVLSSANDVVRLRCCCGPCKPYEGPVQWYQDPPDPLDPIIELIVERNGKRHSILPFDAFLSVGGNWFEYAAQRFDPPMCTGDRIGLRTCVRFRGCCSQDVGGPCREPTAPDASGCPVGFTYHEMASCQAAQ